MGKKPENVPKLVDGVMKIKKVNSETITYGADPISRRLKNMKGWAEGILKQASVPVPEHHPFEFYIRSVDGIWTKKLNDDYLRQIPNVSKRTAIGYGQKFLMLDPLSKDDMFHPDFLQIKNSRIIKKFKTSKTGTVRYLINDKLTHEYWAALLLEHICDAEQGLKNNQIQKATLYAMEASRLYAQLEHWIEHGELVKIGRGKRKGGKTMADKISEKNRPRNDKIYEGFLESKKCASQFAKSLAKDNNFWKKNLGFRRLKERAIQDVINKMQSA